MIKKIMWNFHGCLGFCPWNFTASWIKMGYSRKNPNKGVEDMGFPGVYQRNSIWNFQELIKTKWNIQGWPRKSNMEFPRVFVFGLELSKARDLAQFYGISVQGLSFVLSGISRG